MSSELAVHHRAPEPQSGHAASWIEVVRRFFEVSPSELSGAQLQEVEYHQLKELVRQSRIWLLVLFIAAAFVWMKGEHASLKAMSIWTACLLASVIPYGYLLYGVIHLNPADNKKVRQWLVIWTVWLTVVSIVWLSGNWALRLLPFTPDKAPPFVLDRQIFVYLSLLGQLFTTILFSSRRDVLFTVLVLGIFVPFNFIIKHQLIEVPNPRLNETAANVFFNGQIALYLIIGWFVSGTQKRLYRRQFLLESEGARVASERERADAERQRANHFIETVSHDLKQPLQTMTVMLEMLKHQASHTPDIMVTARNLERHNRALGEMVQACFDLSRLSAGTWDVNIREVVLPLVVKAVVSEAEIAASVRGLTFDGGEVPQYLVRTDQEALARILRNLIGNAIKYTPSAAKNGQGRVSLEFSTAEDQQSICISVVDNGNGIPKDRLDDVFEAYVQLDNPERDRARGFGLGLSIVKGLTRLLNHHLSVSSREGEGSRFSVTIPIVAKIPPELTSVQDGDDKEPDLSGLVMVFVENEVEQRETLTQYLNNFGCYVVSGGTAAEAIAKIEDEGVPDGPHFALSDYRLSGSETGLTAIAAIRERFGQLLPCAIITAETSPEILQSIAVHGIQLLPKPFEARQLATILTKYRPR